MIGEFTSTHRKYFAKFDKVEINFVPRSTNMVANWVVT